MLNVQEYITYKPHVLWIHALDAVRHALKKDLSQTAYGDQGADQETYKEWLEAMERHSPDPRKFADLVEECFRPSRATREVLAEQGDLDVDQYLQREPLCFFEPVKKSAPKLGLTLVLDAGIPWGERNNSDMVPRHEKCYRLALEAESNGRPCRVIAAWQLGIPEITKGAITVFCVIKDYADPIFPAIWGTFASNKTTNSWINVSSDYLIGTAAYWNGYVQNFAITPFLGSDEEVILIDCRRITL